MTDYCECGGIGPYRCEWCKQKEELIAAKKDIATLMTDFCNEHAKVERLREALAEMVRCFDHDFEVNVIDAAVDDAKQALVDTVDK